VKGSSCRSGSGGSGRHVYARPCRLQLLQEPASDWRSPRARPIHCAVPRHRATHSPTHPLNPTASHRNTQVRASCLGRHCLFLFVAPPSHAELERRLRGRGTETEDKVLKRLANAQEEIRKSGTPGLFDRVVVNNDLETAVLEVGFFSWRGGVGGCGGWWERGTEKGEFAEC